MKFEMSDAFIFRTLLEGVFALFLIWGLFNEEKFVAFEDKIKNNIVEDVTNKNEETNKRKLTIFQKLRMLFS